MEGEKKQQRLHVVLVPFPALGHLTPTVELAKALSTTFTITIVSIPPFLPDPPVSSLISSLPGFSFLHLPPTQLPSSSSFRLEAFASTAMDLYTPSITNALQTLLATSSAPIAALVVDLMCSSLLDVGHELGIPTYIFYITSAAVLAFHLHMPILDPMIPNDRKAVEAHGEAVPFPGFSSKLPLPAITNDFAHGKDDSYYVFLRHVLRFRRAKGILVNTFTDIQPNVLKALEEGLYVPDQPTPPVHAVGPLLPFRSEIGRRQVRHPCIAWLDGQPVGSVVLLCFGSLGRFVEAQVREISIGLERSGHRFLWILRAPPKPGEADFVASSDAVLEDVLPDGFIERTKERGLVWPSFAPQTEILGHEAVGGFVTHSGWSSCMESLWYGVPMAAWPLYAEQSLLALEMVEEIGVSVGVKMDRLKGNWAAAEEVERAVRVLMGEESGALRARVKELQGKMKKAVEAGGSSYLALEKVKAEWAAGVAA